MILPAIVVAVLMLSAPVAFSQENLELNNQTASAMGQTVTFTVSVNNAPNTVDAIGVDITFAPEVLRFDGFTSGPLVQNWDFFHASAPAAGQIRLAGFTVRDIIAAGTSGDLVFLNFTVLNEGAAALSMVAPVDDVATWTRGTGQLDVTVNGAPQANAGPDQDLVLAPEQTTVTVTLDGSASDDPDGGTIHEFRWTGIPDPDDVERPRIILGPGTHDFTLIVVDDQGTSSAEDLVQIRVFTVAMLTPQPGNVVAGNAVTLAAVGRTDIQSILFQGRPAGTTEPQISAQPALYPSSCRWIRPGLAMALNSKPLSS
jgi:cohesin domain-containing protein